MINKIKSYFYYLLSNKEDKNEKKELKEVLGFYPINLEYFRTAFLHKSATYIDHTGKTVNNERLEYLGDTILDAIIGDFLFQKYPKEDEGFLTQTRSKIVNRKKLFSLAQKIGIVKFIVLHTNQSVSKKNIYGDAFESFIGAIYLDRGFDETYKFVISQIVNKHIDLQELIDTDNNYKSQIIEWSQKHHKEILFITDTCKKEFNFISYVVLKDEIIGKGKANSKKEAEQKAAEKAIEKINK